MCRNVLYMILNYLLYIYPLDKFILNLLWLPIWLGNQANNLYNTDELNLQINDPANCSNRPADSLPAKFSHPIHCRRHSHRNPIRVHSFPEMLQPLDHCCC